MYKELYIQIKLIDMKKPKLFKRAEDDGYRLYFYNQEDEMICKEFNTISEAKMYIDLNQIRSSSVLTVNIQLDEI